MRTLYCEYESRVLETPPERISLIRLVHGKEADRAIYTREDSRHRSAAVKFWRKDAKQREERIRLDPELARIGAQIQAFDGQILREFSPRDGGKEGPIASLSTAKKVYWEQSSRKDPISFIYKYYELPFSQVFSEPSTFSCVPIRRGSDQLYRVLVKCGMWPVKGSVLEVLFDERLLPLERLVRVPHRPGELVLNHKYTFNDYRPYPLSSGETTWFPNRVTYSVYDILGKMPNGDPLEIYREEITFNKVQFNIDMPDSLFELEIPKNVRVYDGVTGLGWLPPGVRPAALFPAEAQSRRRWWTAGVVLTAIAAVAAGVLYVRSKRRSALARD